MSKSNPRQCASRKLHVEWNCPSDSPITRFRPSKKVMDKLFDKMNKKLKYRNYKKSNPKFCVACVEKVTELYPELAEKEDQVLVREGELTPQMPDPADEGASMDMDPGPSTHTFTVDARGDPMDTHEECIQKDCSVQTENIVIDCADISVKQLTNEQRIRLAYELGLFEAKNRLSDTSLYKGKAMRDIQNLMELNLNDYLLSLNGVVRAFVCGIAEQDIDRSSKNVNIEDKTAYLLCKSVESILNLTSLHAVLPIHFRESVLLYVMTGSKLALLTVGGGSPYGSYQTVRSWLSNLAKKPSEVPQGDVMAAFDNNQIMKRRWRVQLNNTVHCNVVTMVVYFELDTEGRLQFEEDEPGQWYDRPLSIKEKDAVFFLDKQDAIKQTHYSHLYPFLEKIICKVAEEQERSDDHFGDHIDGEVLEKRKLAVFKKCANCGNEQVPKNKRNCPSCNENIKKSQIRATGVDDRGTYTEKVIKSKATGGEFRVKVEASERGSFKLKYEKQGISHTEYSDFEDKHTFQPPLHVHEPVFVNPCSYSAVAVVLRKIGSASGIKQYGTGDRKWTVVICDGVPYNLCRRIINSSYLCSLCGTSCNGRDECQSHSKGVHDLDCTQVVFTQEFSWVLLQPGPGHIEINMVKGFVELTWDVFWKDLVKLLNFRSEQALKCAKKVSDHHKGWTLCRIAREAIVAELVLPFVRKELLKEEPSLDVRSFLKFTMNAQNPNYTFMCDAVFELLDAIFAYRVGVRCGNTQFMEAGRAKFAKVWSGRVHPLYRELEMADTLNLLRMPVTVKKLVEKTMSLNTSGRPYTGEGGDFRLEEVNKVIQQWLPKVPSGKDWEMICSNHDDLVKFRSIVFEQVGISDPKASRGTAQNITQEVKAFRTLLRDKKYLLKPEILGDHVSLDNSQLDPQLRDFCKLAREKRATFAKAFLEQEVTEGQLRSQASNVHFLDKPVFTTLQEGDEHRQVENKTIAEISRLVEELIDGIVEDEDKDLFQCAWLTEVVRKSGKKATKSDYIQFFYEVKEYLENETVYMDGLDELSPEDAN